MEPHDESRDFSSHETDYPSNNQNDNQHRYMKCSENVREQKYQSDSYGNWKAQLYSFRNQRNLLGERRTENDRFGRDAAALRL